MKKFYLLAMVMVFCTVSLFSRLYAGNVGAGYENPSAKSHTKSLDDDTYYGDIALSTQEDIDQFPVNYPGILYIAGQLQIMGSADISDLSGLNQLLSVNSLIISDNAQLSNLSGLNNLQTISQDFTVSGTVPAAMYGLNGVTTIGGSLTISNTSLASFTGFNALQSVNQIQVYGNVSLTSLPQFLSLTSVNYISIYQNPSLSVCNQPGICANISLQNANVFENAGNCINLQHIQQNCGIPVTCSDVYLYSQADVDAFTVTYGCSSIHGTLYISGTDITNLNALSPITSVDYLNLNNLPNLTNASGLNNLTTISHDLSISGDMPATLSALQNVTGIGGNFNLNSYDMISFLGLSNVATIGGELSISSNQTLTALPGMIHLTSVGGEVSISYNQALASLSGLNNLATIGGSVYISGNSSLTGISALSHLTSISGSLQVYSNNSLTSLSGLDNLASTGITGLYIQYNPLLATCNEPAICAYLANNGSNSIYGNAMGCNTQSQVRVSCGTPQNCNYVYLYGQYDVDHYQYNYGCSAVGSLYISGSDITNLNGLAQITSVENLSFSSSQNLTSISGLSNLTTISGNLYIYGQTQATFPAFPGLTHIGGNLQIENTSMTHLPSFPALTSIGGTANINYNQSLLDMGGMPLLTSIGGGLNLNGNTSLGGLTALGSVTGIDGQISISNNDALASLDGLENINPTGITGLYLNSDSQLATCGLPNLCTYLNGGGNYSISGNAVGCMDYFDVSAVCNAGCPTGDVYLNSQADVDAFAVSYPTCTLIPSSLYISGADITYLNGLSNISNVLGTMQISNNDTLVSLTGLQNLATVHDGVSIVGNNALTSFTGLGALASVGQNLHIEANGALTSFSGLGALNHIGYSLEIFSNPVLSDISALGGLTSLPNGYLDIYQNDALTSLNGLSNLATAASGIKIRYNASLASISALSALSSASSLEVLSNPSLASVGGLNALLSLSFLNVDDNDAMINLGWSSPVSQISNLYVTNNAALAGISSLASVTSSDYVNIQANPSLASLGGLGSLSSVNNLNIVDNDALTNLNGLGGLTSVSNFNINENDNLINLSGLENLALTADSYPTLTINDNAALTSLSGLNNVTGLYNLSIGGNATLTSLSALSSMTVLHYLTLNDNASLTSLSGLDNLIPAQLYSISIQSSAHLSTCNVSSICTFLSNGGPNTISGNATGCNNSLEVQIACGSTSQCPTGAITFTNQAQIDAFAVAFPNCTSMPSYVTISGADITNLTGLSHITSIANPLVINNNPLLTNLSGLNNLTFVGSLTISNNASLNSVAALSNLSANCYSLSVDDNDALTSLNGLQNLPLAGSIGIANNDALTSLVAFTNLHSPQYVTVSNNDALVSLASLSGMASLYSLSITGNDLLTNVAVTGLASCSNININDNAALTNLNGLNALNPNNISGIAIYSNPNLSVCNSPVVCTFLSNGGYAYIDLNATGCANTTEVQVSCGNGAAPTFGSVSPTAVTVCDGQDAALTLSGLVAGSTSLLTYTFDGISMATVSVSANATGTATLNVPLSLSNNGQALTLVSIERTDVSTGTLSIASGNAVSLTVSAPITYYRDYDGDGFGSISDTMISCTGIPAGYVSNSTDCYDYDASVYNTASNVYYDSDHDGYDSGQNSICYGASIPAEYSLTTNGPDCDDNNPLYHDRFPFYYDSDGDGYGSGTLQNACAANATTPPQNYSTNNTDCSPFNAAIFTSATLYTDVDGDQYNNGNGVVCYGASVPAGYSATTLGADCDDNDAAKHTGYPFYADTDGDGYGAGSLQTACAVNPVTPPVGYSNNNTDCAPSNASAWRTGILYIDADGDHYDNGSQSVCYGNSAPNGYSLTTNGADCNDNNPTVNSGYSFYADTDNDGYGSGNLINNICALNATTAPAGYSLNNSDCAPTDPAVHLGYPFYADADGDGYGTGTTVTFCTSSAAVAPPGYSVNNTDCNDTNAAVHPGAQEICNGIDDDCDGLVDDLDPSILPSSQSIFYADNDNDSYGNAVVFTRACIMPSGYAANNTDCDDNNAAVHPGAPEICNGIDDDCDGLVDGDDPSILISSEATYYADADHDGFGNPNASIKACVQPNNYVTDNTDCDDTNAQLHPGQSWIPDNDNDGYGSGSTVISCTRPLHGHFANELTSATGDCNDNDATINPGAQRLVFSGTPNFTNSLISPQNGTLYTNFTFDVTYYDANNQLPTATFPRVYLDYEGDGNFNGANDRAVIMTPYDANDMNTADGKRYIGTISGLPYGTNWQTRVQVQNGACVTAIGPFNYPDVQVQSDLQIFANDITFSSNHPAASSPLTVNAVIHNVSDFAAQNFTVKLVNQYDPSIVYGDVSVSNVSPHATSTVSWNITTPSVPAWCPMQVIVDNTNVISEADELDNTAIRPFINGNYNLLGGIEVVNSGSSPTVSYIASQQDYISVFGRGQYFGTPTPLPDPSVAGATVTFTIDETGASYSTYTNSQGYFSGSFPAPMIPGIYHIHGELTDYTFIGTFTSQFERIVYVQPCPTDLFVDLQTTANTAIVSDNLPPNTILPGESISGNFTVHNGCAAVGATVIGVNQNGGTVISNVNVPALASGGTFTSNFNNIVFNTPGSYTICATADATNLINEVNENNTGCTTITVLQNLPDIYPEYGPGNTAQVCSPSNLGFTLHNGGGAVTGSFNCDIIVRKNNVVLATLHQAVPNINALSSYGFSIPYTFSSAGNYTFELRCDVPLPNGIITETDETNNVVTYGITAYDCIFKPDLTLLGCENFDVSPADVQFPGTVTYSATIQNSGDAVATGPIGVRFQLSGGQFYNTQYNGNLAPGQSAVVTVNAPSVAPATQNLTAIVDYGNTVAEWSEDNNSITNSLCWDFEPVDRHYPCGSNFWDTTQIVNQPVYLSVGVNQYGMYDASSVDVKFEVSGPGLSGTVNLGTATIANMEQTCYCPDTAALPYSFIFPQEGVYTFTMTVDPNHHYTECNEANNVLVRTVNVTHLPDMRVLSQYINPSLLNPDPGQPITLSVTYENIGTTNIQDNMQLSVYVDQNSLASVPVTGLGTGENATVAIPVPWSSTVVGPHIVRAVIDSANQIAESNETNNEATRAIVVGQAANLHFNTLAASNPSPSLGAPIMINATIGNNGDLDCEADVVFYYMTDGLQQVQIGTIHVSVGNNSSANIQLPWTVLDPSTTIVAKIINSSVLEFTYDDNESSTTIGGMGLSFQSTAACGQGNGTVTVLPSGGIPPYSYAWENGYNGATLIAAAGTYSVTVTDNTGLSATSGGTISAGTGSTTYYADADHDGFGNAQVSQVACAAPAGYVTNNTDCNDTNANVHASYPFYADNDNDGFGGGNAVAICAASAASPPAGYSINGTDCDDTKATVHPGAVEIGYNLIDDDCDGLIDEGFPPKNTTITGTMCNTVLPALDTQLYADVIAGAQGYRWRVTAMSGPNSGQVQFLDTSLRVMKLTQLLNYAYATTYKIEVAVYFAGYLQPYTTSLCTVTTPVYKTKLTVCGQALVSTSDVIYANIAPFAAGYRFRITDPANPSNTQMLDRSVREFRMNLITAFAVLYNKVYNVEVSVKNNDGTYLPFGDVCQVTTPAFPTTSLQDQQCNDFAPATMATPIYANSYNGAIGYVFNLTGNGLPAQGIEITKTTRTFKLSDFTGLIAGATYNVRVRLIFNLTDVSGPYGKTCTVIVPGISRTMQPAVPFDAVAYPNPFADDFDINVSTDAIGKIAISVYDMTGRLLEQREVAVDKMDSVHIGDSYPSGVYNIILTQGNRTKTLRVVKR